MSKIVRIIRKCRIHSRVLLDNGQSEKILTANAVVGTFFDPHRESMSVNNPISSENMPLTESTNQKSETIHIFEDFDVIIEVTDKSTFNKKYNEKEKEGFELIELNTRYRPKQDPPNKFYLAKFKKKDNLP